MSWIGSDRVRFDAGAAAKLSDAVERLGDVTKLLLALLRVSLRPRAWFGPTLRILRW
jgi:hypothetical protein